MLNKGLSAGWQSWAEYRAARRYAYMRLRQAASKLHQPELLQAFGFLVRPHS